MSVNASAKNNTNSTKRAFKKNMNDAMTDVVLDVKRVASSSAPHKTGFLDQNAQHNISYSGGKVSGTVSFSAFNSGFNYAKWTHDNDYELGAKSRGKSGGKSKIGGGSVPVGKGYLKNSVENNKRGYLDYLEKAFSKSFK